MPFFTQNKINNNKSLEAAAVDWFRSAAGQHVLSAESQVIQRYLEDCFGYYLLQISLLPEVNFTQNSLINNKFCLHHSAETANVLAEAEYLPFPEQSIDTVILHHSHELSEHPQQILREIDRVLVNRGHLIIVGFNPLSLFAATRCVKGRAGFQWFDHWLTMMRVKDWLKLLGFNILESKQGAHGLPIFKDDGFLANNLPQPVTKALRNSPFGAFYCISAVKQPSVITPHKLKWQKKKVKIPGLAVEPPVIGKTQNKTSNKES